MQFLLYFVVTAFSLVGALSSVDPRDGIPLSSNISGSDDYWIWMTHRTYNDPDGDYCRDLFKIYWTLDVVSTCVQSNRAKHLNEFVKMTVYDFTTSFQVYESYYADSACKNLTDSKNLMYNGYWPNVCYNQQEYQATYPVGYTNLGDYGYEFGVWIYNNASNCEAKTSVGANSVLYGNLNECFNSSNTFQGDYKYTSCSAEEGLVINHYPSTDGTCVGDATTTKLTPEDTCTSADYSVSAFTRGWANFACSKYV